MPLSPPAALITYPTISTTSQSSLRDPGHTRTCTQATSQVTRCMFDGRVSEQGEGRINP
jgi:hypothetical protein